MAALAHAIDRPERIKFNSRLLYTMLVVRTACRLIVLFGLLLRYSVAMPLSGTWSDIR
jgi:hypothetical protein